ncbi:T4SS efffector SepA family protein [Donghicola tyrosinivorans]|uniref:Uncharacterized protein n=1 Tax=Donghicola tyrosinivorans TaxID=1652492 RepID=A0A2T0WWE9_9RHOB|nr:hypothetical protein [Donghicola tyrosinivorans]PRY91026.1 hypothetical protein CLV74_10438 [Donghicola tyrosinivorans]
MPVVRISDATFVDLKSIATWLDVETPALTIEQLVRDKMAQLGLERDDPHEIIMPSGASCASLDESIIEFKTAPGLTFARVRAASVDGCWLEKTNWSVVLLQVISAVMKKHKMDANSLARELQVPSKPYEFNEEGYKYYSHLGLSIQGQSAPDAWREIERLAQKHRVAVEVRFQWSENDKAQYPGKVGMLRAGI